jgi:prepilin-type N-terminal cleavage/methylation domain-containing protein
MNERHAYKQGFTLIELSIVLVTIGLIVGGVLVGQDLIRSATVRAQISQLQKYNTAVNTFRTKYGYLPGDMPVGPAAQFEFYVDSYCGLISHPTNIYARDGSGIIDNSETDLAWLDLSQAGLIDQSFTLAPWTAASGSPCNILVGNVPSNYCQINLAAKLTGNFVAFNSDNAANWFALALPLFPFAISASDAYQIDTKIDDGKPTTRNVVARYYYNGVWTYHDIYLSAATDSGTTAAPISGPPCWNSTTMAYATSYQKGISPSCLLSVKLQ